MQHNSGDEWMHVVDAKELKEIHQCVIELKQEVALLRNELSAATQELKELRKEKEECRDCNEIREAYAKVRKGVIFPYFKKL